MALLCALQGASQYAWSLPVSPLASLECGCPACLQQLFAWAGLIACSCSVCQLLEEISKTRRVLIFDNALTGLSGENGCMMAVLLPSSMSCVINGMGALECDCIGTVLPTGIGYCYPMLRQRTLLPLTSQ